MSNHIPTLGFDLDGTLIDTTSFFERVCLETFQSHDVPLTSRTFREFSGRGLRSMEWFQALGVTDRTIMHSILLMRDAAMITLLERETTWMPGARDMLQQVKDRQRDVYVVTNSQLKFVAAVRRCLPELDELVTTTICADSVGIEPKPHKSGIRHAMTLSNCPPEKFVYVGDQLFDCLAAQNAGSLFCAYQQEHTHVEAIDGAHFVIDALSDVPSIRLRPQYS